MIHLPTACHEDWQNMTPVEGGRHCNSCNKVLPDFSVMSDEEIQSHLLKSGAGCGRFRADQVTDGTTYGGWKFYTKWKSAVALLMLGSVFLVSCRRNVSGKMSGYSPGDVRDDKKKEQRLAPEFGTRQ